jgi:hypothetical protein
MARPRKFPQTLRRDSISVSIYKTKTNDYETFTVSYYDAGKRRRIVRGSYEEAKKEADLRLTQLAAGLTSDKQLHGDDRAAYLAALAKLKPLGLSLSEAMLEYTQARKTLDGRGSLSEAVRFFMAHASVTVQDISVQEAYERYLARAESRTGDRNIELVKLHVGRFAKAFRCHVNDVTHEQIDAWMDNLNMSGRSLR